MSSREFPWGPVLAGTGAALAAASLAVAFAGRSQAAVRAPELESGPPRVALVGDSYAVGLGPELAKRLPAFRYEGHVGTNTAQLAGHAAACGACGDWLAAYRPAVTLVSLGVNDGDAPVLANYQAVVSALHGAGSRVLWVEPPAGVSAPAVRRAIAALGVPTVPATSSPLRADGVHPRSYGPWAGEVAAALGKVAA